MLPLRRSYRRAGRSLGVAAVEFALVSTVLVMLLFGGIEFGRLLWTWNAAAEATRLGARLAVVCGQDATTQAFIKSRMQTMLPALGPSNISLSYAPDSCTVTDCLSATVSLSNYRFVLNIPFVPASVNPMLPPFTTTLSREYMTSAGNNICS